ncbi:MULTISPECIES: Hint domain-containing protein [Mameliella]|uniref:Hint domain-containing protein n=1 Tax=Mameliella TaxID=1434019 RepID=UPI000B52C33E|nr:MULTISPECIES: Hint domain-containing protein [Mameliella]MCR9275746.1 Hint domain-containing protein [Paracoccaceae bacterium]OWV63168.1 hypothetical protein CDZ98_03085 [Mameliella alba]
MPFTATYSQYLYIGASAPNASTTYTNDAPTVTSSTLSDTEDGTDDGDIAPGQLIDWSASGGDVQVVGTTASGDPVVLAVGAGSYFVLSNSPFPPGGTPMGFTAGTYTMCFAAGTGIAVPGGEVPVEALSIGDLILTAEGAAVPVKWIGRQTKHSLFSGAMSKLVRIRAGALGDGLPHADLTVTGDHGMVLDGLVINASALVNHDSIDWVPSSELPETFTVYHVETEDHDVILANGAPSETFIDYRDRRAFDNFGEYLDLYGCERIIPEMAHPRISSARQLPAELRARLALELSPCKGAICA